MDRYTPEQDDVIEAELQRQEAQADEPLIIEQPVNHDEENRALDVLLGPWGITPEEMVKEIALRG